jgi:hypothetical protein
VHRSARSDHTEPREPEPREHEPAGWLDAADAERARPNARKPRGAMLNARTLEALGWRFFRGVGQPIFETPAGDCYAHLRTASQSELVLRFVMEAVRAPTTTRARAATHDGATTTATPPTVETQRRLKSAKSVSVFRHVSSPDSRAATSQRSSAMRNVWELTLTQAAVLPSQDAFLGAATFLLSCYTITELIKLSTYLLMAQSPGRVHTFEALVDPYISPILAAVGLVVIVGVNWTWNGRVMHAGHAPIPMMRSRGKLEYAALWCAILAYYLLGERSALAKVVLACTVGCVELGLALVHSVASAWTDRNWRLAFALGSSQLERQISMVD